MVNSGNAGLSDSGYLRVGLPPENRRQAVAKACWAMLYLSYLAITVSDLTSGRHSAPATVLGGLGLAAYLAGYAYVLFSRRPVGRIASPKLVVLGGLFALSVLLTVTMGGAWLPLMVYVAVSSGVLLPFKWGIRAVVAIALITGGLGLLSGLEPQVNGWIVMSLLLSGAGMAAVAQMGRTMRELREARATVAHLAANEERLRLARDLHDLLGHSLSLITLKSELAGRMLPDAPERAAQQVADIERVSRQALVDVREAVSGFRRPTLGGELAHARTALAAAGIIADLSRAPDRHPDLAPDAEGALAWALREAVTNVVRHSGARRCAVELAEEADELCLTVTDDGRGPERPHGNGLTGLAERLALTDGRLQTGRAARGGFRLRAWVPLSRRVPAEPGEGAGEGASAGEGAADARP
ncbi:sensor histidine kinase [Streptomyces orinoci]|uniref:Sensor histidine kinase n=1 Tax=Streptomyces orinoci TaxID=67339 RepID=A0ABV3JW83_STRON|nr:sensor histidine kinase [Streptomyces orinoci]